MKKMIILPLLLFLLAAHAYAQNTQTIKGRVLDDGSQAPLPGVNVVVTSLEMPMGASTDFDGYYRLDNVPLGRHTIEFSFIGYEKRVASDIIVTAGKEVVLNIVLVEAFETLQEVEVVYDAADDKTSATNEMAVISARSFNLEETRKYAGAIGDPSRMAGNFAGVVMANDARNDIIVRGNSPLGMLWQIDGMMTPNPNHFGALNSTGGPVSMLNNNNLEKSDFLTGAFPAQYGDATAAVFDINLRNGNPDKYEFLGQIGFNGFELGAEGPFSKKSKASFIANYRYSTLGVFDALNIDFGTGSATPVFQDLNLKVNVPIGRKFNVSGFVVAGRSNVDFLGNETDTTDTDLYNSRYTNTKVAYESFISGVTLGYQISPKTKAELLFGYNRTYERFDGDSIDVETLEEYPNGQARFSTDQYNALLRVRHKFNSRVHLYTGGSAQFIGFDLFSKQMYDGGAIEKVRVDQDDETTLYQAFAQLKWRLTSRFTILPGVHYQYLVLNGSSAIEPRLSMSYLVNEKSRLSLGYGLHAQTQPIYTYFVQTPTATGVEQTNIDLGMTLSNHIVLGYDYNITPNTRIKAETYYQWLHDVPVTSYPSSFSQLNQGADFGPSNQDFLVNNGTGENYGVELTAERFFSKGWYFLVTGSLFQSKYVGSDNVERNTAFNTEHALNVLAGQEIPIGKKKNQFLAYNIRASWVGGRYLTPIDLEASKLARQAVYDEENAFSEKQDPYFRIDIRLAYRWEMKSSTMEFAIDLQNVTNHKNVFTQSYDPISESVVTEYQQGFFPVPTFRVTF
jgi:hypothetical protein